MINMFGIFAIKHPGTVEVSNGMGFLCSEQMWYVMLFKTEISQVLSGLGETAFHAELSVSFCAESRQCNFPQNSAKSCL